MNPHNHTVPSLAYLDAMPINLPYAARSRLGRVVIARIKRILNQAGVCTLPSFPIWKLAGKNMCVCGHCCEAGGPRNLLLAFRDTTTEGRPIHRATLLHARCVGDLLPDDLRRASGAGAVGATTPPSRAGLLTERRSAAHARATPRGSP